MLPGKGGSIGDERAPWLCPQVGGVPVPELNRLELEMLKALDFRLLVSIEELGSMIRTLSSLPAPLPGQHWDWAQEQSYGEVQDLACPPAKVLASPEPISAKVVRRRNSYQCLEVKGPSRLESGRQPSKAVGRAEAGGARMSEQETGMCRVQAHDHSSVPPGRPPQCIVQEVVG